MSCGLARFGRDRQTCLDDELLGGFVKADHGTIRIMRPVIDFQHVFHRGHEGGACIGRNDELLCQMRLEVVFLRPANGVIAGLGHDVQFHDAMFQQAQRPAHAASRRLRAGERDQLGFRRTVENPLPG